MDPAYATTDPSLLYVTTSGLAAEVRPGTDPAAFTPLTPILYDPRIMSTPWYDAASGVYAAQLADGTVVPVAVSAADVAGVGAESSWWTPGMTTTLGTGLQSLATQLTRMFAPASAPATALAPGVVGGMSGTTLLLLGVGAFFLLRKRR